jgi:uncharacterized membrane protein
MNIPFGLLSPAWYWFAAVFYGLLLAHLIHRAPWTRLREEAQLHVYLGTCVGLMLLWMIKTPILPGIEYHYLGATLLTLMFGWRLAAVGMSVVLAGSVFNGTTDWATYPLNALVMGFVPVALSHAVLRLSERHLPPNFFIYVFVVAYWGAAFAVATAVVTGAGVLWTGGVYPFDALSDKYFPLLVLLMVPEGMITGMLIALMVVFRPAWVGTFDDNRYIKGR